MWFLLSRVRGQRRVQHCHPWLPEAPCPPVPEWQQRQHHLYWCRSFCPGASLSAFCQLLWQLMLLAFFRFSPSCPIPMVVPPHRQAGRAAAPAPPAPRCGALRSAATPRPFLQGGMGLVLGSAWPLPRLWWDLPAPTTATSAAPGTLQQGVCYLRRQSTNCQGKQRCSSHAAPVRRGG